MCADLVAESRKATPTSLAPSAMPSHTAASSGTSTAAAAAADTPPPSPPAAAAAAVPVVPLNRTSSKADSRPGEACLRFGAWQRLKPRGWWGDG